MKRKAFTLINLLGLSTGMAVCLMLMLYIQNELGYDKFHEKGDQIYRLALERIYPSRTAFMGEIPSSIGLAVKQEFPEVLESMRVLDFGGDATTINAGDKIFDEKKIFAADSNFFSVFTAFFIQGDKNTALQKPGTAIVNESTAKRFFGSAEKAMGKALVVNGFQNYVIDGVIRNWPEKSHFQFNVVVSATGFSDLNEPNYYDLTTYTYLLLKNNASSKSLEAKLPLIVEKYVAGTIEKGFGETYDQFKKEGNGYKYFLQPIKKIHLYSDLQDEFRPNGSIKRVYLSAAIALFILFLACINFINLSTTLSVERAREVGIRKTFGSDKNALIWQFLSESVLFSLVSIVFSALLVQFFIPVLNRVSGTQLSFAYFLHPLQLLLILGFAIFIGMVAGLYPAFVLSSFRPIVVLKGRFKYGSHGMALRNGLIIFQFAVSVILIICTIIINNQLQFMLGNKLGFKKDHIIVIDAIYRLQNQQNSFYNEISKIAGVEEWSKFSNLPDGSSFPSCAMQVADTKVSRTQLTTFADERYLGLLGLRLKAGRFFSKDFASDSLSLVLNEKAVEDFGLKNPIGSRLTSTELFFNPPDGKSLNVYTVIGVVKDFHFQSLHKKISPLVIANTIRFGAGRLGIRIKGEKFKSALAAIEKIWKQFEPKHSLQYTFLDQTLAQQYKAEQSGQKIFTTFSILAIFIACIGLFGLAAYSTQQRTKEISLRKVLGATPVNILIILSKDFLKLIIVSTLVAFPLAWWSMHTWLQNFAYRINMSWWVFLLAGTIATIVAMITISFHSIRTAIANPIKGLRTE